MDLIFSILIFIAGLVCIVKGGDAFVDAAGSIARIKKIPPFVIGATIVAVATTLPEILVSTFAAAEGKIDIAVGNGLGSVIANTAMVMAVAMLAMNIVCKREHYLKQLLLLIATISVLYVSCIGGELHIVGVVALIAIAIIFLYVNYSSAKDNPHDFEDDEEYEHSMGKNILFFLLGAAFLVIGSKLIVEFGSEIALGLGIDERVVAVCMIAVGTALPELVTTITAIIKKQSALGVGNIIGANIIDLALILPLCSIVSGGSLPVSDATLQLDLPICLIVTLIATVPLIIKERAYRVQGLALLCTYAVYIALVI